MGNMIKGFILMIGQILKKLIIIAIVAMVLIAIYFSWTKFIKKTQKHTQSAATARAEKQGITVKK